MSVAWTTVVIIAFLLPGVLFFVGFWARERHSREVIKSSVVGDIGLAILFASAIHLAVWVPPYLFGFDLWSFFIKPIADYGHKTGEQILDVDIPRAAGLLFYIIGTGVLGLVLGAIGAWFVMHGQLRGLATHKWIYDLLDLLGKQGRITVYVVTSTVQDNKALMYKGHLVEFYLDADGRFTYVVLKNCSRYFMRFGRERPTTTAPVPIFRASAIERQWDYLMIDGSNIANILFDPSGDIQPTDRGTQKLQEAIQNLQATTVDASAWTGRR